MTDLLVTPAERPLATLLLAHGAGGPMDSPFLVRLTEALVAEGLSVARYEFGYMAARRTGAGKKPPPKAERLVEETRAALDTLLARTTGPVLLAGKSMGGRVSVMAAGGDLDPRVKAVAVFGYPFHAPGRPEAIRREPLDRSRLPVLVMQGERDEFGPHALAAGLGLGDHVRLEPVPDGNHDFGPRGASGATLKGNVAFAARTVAGFVRSLG